MAILTSAPMQEVGRLPAPAAVAVGVAALILVLMPGLWEIVSQVNTMAHEGAHAVVGSCQGRRVRGVRLSALSVSRPHCVQADGSHGTPSRSIMRSRLG